ncbi:hypothetical protein UFOVP247_193 [uncultured Caudovirales phage]|uniref:Uncharacterized protein n=1 Tax=uncultured Caudovirales phage TaxID=2100421 RepID=A0A6J7WTW9_9CAUD|nr:hypothetical protein UFOVP247_193 [uncultured Caudovirales phage]
MKNEKVLIRTIAGLGVDSATSYLDFLVNKNDTLLFGTHNRSYNASVSGQFFKTKFLLKHEELALGANNLELIDRESIRQYLHSNFLNGRQKLKIIASHYKFIDYDYIFDDFYRVDIVPTNKNMMKLFLIFLYKFSLFPMTTPYEKQLSEIRGMNSFYDYSNLDPEDNYPLQLKLKRILRDNENGAGIKIPLFITFFAEENRSETDYEYFIEEYWKKFTRNMDVKFKTDCIIDAERYLFDETSEVIDALTSPYSDEFTKDEYDQIKRYNIKKVLGNLEILDELGYDDRLELLSDAEKKSWILQNFVPLMEKTKVEFNYK